ncbi:hypothetical protein HY642_04615 [Candidatus Woesearchaeota archaeon]|nr:hypothetical protein [Candidatus Woesearchaeota archaeon]
MAMNKRGVFFTIIAVLLVALAVVTMLSFTATTPMHAQSAEVRIRTLDAFLRDTETNIDRALTIAATRAILAFEQEALSAGKYIDSVQAAFPAAVLNGTYHNRTLTLLENATLEDWTGRVKAQAATIGIQIDLGFSDVAITHASPWILQANLTASISLADAGGLASFAVVYKSNASFSIIGFEDPLYPLNTLARVPNIINQSPFAGFVTNNETTNLQLHVNHSYYIAHPDAPSFLMRLEGNLSNSTHGIESLVYLPKLSAQNIALKSRTVVDYLYFGNQTVTDYAILNMSSWFRIDEAHLAAYEVDGLAR